MAAKKTLAELAKVIADHQANLSRLGEAWGQVVADALDDTDRKLIARMEDLVADVQANYRRNTAKAVNQLEYIRTKIEEIRIRAFVKAEKELRKTVPDLIENETKWSKKLLSELTGESKAKFADVTSGQAEKLLKNSIQINKTWDQWWTNTAAGDVMRIADVINAGVVQGLTIPQMTRLIRGTKEGNFTDGVLSTSRRHARNMARTLCAGISNQAKDQFYRDNQDIIPQVEWLDTLDGRTCPSCAGLSRRRYDTDKPHPVPPIHPSCRCVLLPVTELTDLGEDVPRPAANADFDAEAKRMYEEKYPQKHFEDLAPSTREQYRHKAIHEYEERTGKPAFTRAPGSMTFAEFFEQSSEQFKKDWLKPGKYALYKSGKYPITAFIPPHPDRAFGVKQLKEMDIDSFKGVKWVKSRLFGKTDIPEPSFEIKGMRGIAEQMRQIIGTEKVDLKGITDENMANRINKALYNIKKKYPDFFLSGVRTDTTLKTNEPAAVNWFNELLLNPDYINHIMTTYSQYSVIDGKYDIDDVAAMYHGNEIETIIYHEAGHILYNIKIGNGGVVKKGAAGSKERRHKLAVLKRMYRRAKKDGYASGISDWATENEKEFFSEVIAAEKFDKRGVPDYIKIGTREVLK